MNTKIIIFLACLISPVSIVKGAVAAVEAGLVEQYGRVAEQLKQDSTASLLRNLELFKVRITTLTERQTGIEGFLRNFKAWLDIVTTDGWDPDYGIILEDINAHPDSRERNDQLSTFAELISLITDENLQESTRRQIEPLLNQRKHVAMDAKISLVRTKYAETSIGHEVTRALIAQVKQTFGEDLHRLSAIDNALAESWTLPSDATESGLAAVASATLVPIIDLCHQWLAEQEKTKCEEIGCIESNLSTLQQRFAKLKGTKSELAEILRQAADSDARLRERVIEMEVSVRRLMEGAEENFNREFYRLIELNPYSEVWQIEP
jgi:hypothetical protein